MRCDRARGGPSGRVGAYPSSGGRLQALDPWTRRSGATWIPTAYRIWGLRWTGVSSGIPGTWLPWKLVAAVLLTVVALACTSRSTATAMPSGYAPRPGILTQSGRLLERLEATFQRSFGKRNVCLDTGGDRHFAWYFSADRCNGSQGDRRYAYVFSRVLAAPFYTVLSVVGVLPGSTTKLVLVRARPLACDAGRRHLVVVDPSSVPFRLLCSP